MFSRVWMSVIVAAAMAFVATTGVASATQPWWSLSGTALPTNLPPGGDGTITVGAVNVGDGTTAGDITVTDTLPPGLTAQKVELLATPFGSADLNAILGTCTLTPSRVDCHYPGEFALPGLTTAEQIQLLITVKVAANAVSGESQLEVTGGGGGDAMHRMPVTVDSAPASFGIEGFSMVPENEGGTVDTTAGSHPFQLTTTVGLNQTDEPRIPPALPKTLRFDLPPGLIGNPSPLAQCTESDFTHFTSNGTSNFCAPDTAIGVATVYVFTSSIESLTVPVFNLTPRPGEPARFGFVVVHAPVIIDTSVRTGQDYGVTATVHNITQLVGFLGSKLTLWGVPGDARHDNARGWPCILGGRLAQGETCSPLGLNNPPAFLTLPTACDGPLTFIARTDSWPTQSSPAGLSAPAVGYQTEDGLGTPAGMTGCDQLPFNPSIRVTPDGTAASAPTGLTVDVHIPQEQTLNSQGLAEASPKDITVSLPPGVAVNPSAGDGLQTCTESLAGFTGFGEVDGASSAMFTPTLPGSNTAIEGGEGEPLQQGLNFCPDASKIGTVTIRTPLLPNPIEGAVYLATQNANPFGGLLALYLIAEDPGSGVVVKLAGETQITTTGQILATFRASPQAPFEDAELHFFGGERAPLATPARCGPYTTDASITPWSGTPPAEPSSTFNLTTGPNGSPCPGATLPFAPSLTGGTTNINAGSFTPLTTTIGRVDGQQNISSVSLHLPAGLSGILAGVKLCPEAQANEGTCGTESLIGETTVSAGIGSDPVAVKGGRIYLTEKYAGAPFGLSIVNPVKAGPVDLEHDTSSPTQQPACDCIVVRAKVEVDPHTAALTVTTDGSGPHAIPTIVDGVPVQIQKINVTVNRQGFTFNPTNCSPMNITGAIDGDEGTSDPLTVPFQVTNCASLSFKPSFKVSVTGRNSRANGAGLSVKLTYPHGSLGHEANLGRVKVELPVHLPSRLTTLQQACLASVFDVNPSSCPAASVVGHAKVITPLLPVPLAGPAYFVSHGGEQFPDLTIVLKGYGVTVDLVGATFISKKGITSTTFKAPPDVPFETFELTLPQQKFSAVTASANLCALTRSTTVRKRTTIHSHGHVRHVIRKITRRAGSLVMPTEFTAQDGAEIHQNTPIDVTGCSARSRKHHK
jgi:hypothetical protein